MVATTSDESEIIDAEVLEDAAHWPVFDAAIEYLNNGWTPTPLRGKIPTQKKWVGLKPSRADCWTWWVDETHDGVGIICGTISGNLWVIDIEGALLVDHPERWQKILLAAGDLGVRDLISSAAASACSTTPSGGRHLFFTITGTQIIPGSKKLARIHDPSHPKADRETGMVLLAETKGEGGQVASPPAKGRRWIGTGGPGQTVEITFEQANLLGQAFASVDEPDPNKKGQQERRDTGRDGTGTSENSPFDKAPNTAGLINRAVADGALTPLAVLPNGWRLVGSPDEDGRQQVVRPGADSPTSGNVIVGDHDNAGIWFFHSTAVAWAHAAKGMTSAQVWAEARFDGDMHAALTAVEQASRAVAAGDDPGDTFAAWPLALLSDIHDRRQEAKKKGTATAGTSTDVAVGQSLIAEELTRQHPGRFMFVPGVGWHTYDGRRWNSNTGLAEKQVEQAVVETARALIVSAAEITNKNERESQLAVAHRTLASDSQLRGAVAFATRHRDLLVGIDDLNAGPFLLNCGNGTLDLLTGHLRAHDPLDRLTKITTANYHPDLVGPRWRQFLTEALGDPQVISAVQQLMGGPGLMGQVREHVLPVIYGRGGSGKGTFINAISDVMGDYSISCEPDLVMRRAGAHPTGEMDLHGVRLAFISESDEGRQLAASTMKRLTGGDKVRARKMRQDFIEFDPSHLLLLVTNHLPVMPAGDDPAIWRRVRVIPFDNVPAKVDKRLPDALAAENDAILSWLVAGFMDYWQRQEIAWPESVTAATATYRSGSDLLGAFLDDCTMSTSSAAPVGTGKVYARWRKWLSDNAPDSKPGRTQDLVRGLRERGEDVRFGDSRNKGTVLAGRMFLDEEDDI